MREFGWRKKGGVWYGEGSVRWRRGTGGDGVGRSCRLGVRVRERGRSSEGGDTDGGVVGF